MKKVVFLLFLILFPAAVVSLETYQLKLRANYHPEFLRIVLEGVEPLISKGIVNQKGRDILVRFPDASFTIQEEKVPLPYKTDKRAIVFSPGHFRKFKVISLKSPSRLVIDVYLEKGAQYVKPPIDVLRKPEKRDLKPPAEVPIKPQKRLIKPPAYIPAKPEKRYEKYPFEAPRKLEKKHAGPLVEPEQPEKPSRMKKLKTIVLDPGHGGYETGLTAENYKEKNVILDIAKRLKVLLNRGATQCFLTRKSDHFVSLEERVKFANSKNAEIFLSLHIGRHSDIVIYTPVITEPAAYEKRQFMVDKGQEDFMLKTTALSNAMQQAIIEDFGDDMVSVKPLPYSILSRISAAALIIELPSFKDAYYVTELKTELVNTIYKGISLYEEGTAN